MLLLLHSVSVRLPRFPWSPETITDISPTRHFAYILDTFPIALFAYGHCKNRHLAIHTAPISTVITQFLLYIVYRSV